MPATKAAIIARPVVPTAISKPSARFQRVWLSAVLVVGLSVTVAWTAFLGYGLVMLVRLAL
jgi:hypothetical protein